MNRRSTKSSAASHRRAITLVEVIAGLALLAGTVSAMLVVRGQCLRQARAIERRREAIASADRLLGMWWQDVSRFPRSARGPVPGRPDLAWQTIRQANPPVEALGGQVVRLEVSDVCDQRPLASVDVVLPAEVMRATGVHTR